MQRHRVNSIITISLTFAAIFFSSALLYKDFQDSKKDLNIQTPAVGSVKKSRGDVKRRLEKRSNWFDITSGQDLYRRDRIRTEKGSTTVLEIMNSGTIEMAENSLIVVEQSKSGTVIDFVDGSIFTQSSGNDLTIRVNNTDINSKGASVRLSKTDQQPTILVKDGNVTIKSMGQEKATQIQKNQTGKISKSGIQDVTEVPFELISPSSGGLIVAAQATNDAKTPVTFKWRAHKPIDGAEFQIATDPEFKTLIQNIPVRPNVENSEMNLGVGTYYWRIAGKQGALSDAHSLSLYPKVPIRLLDPPAEQSIRFSSTIPSITLQWIGPTYFDEYQIEVATDEDFKKTVYRGKTKGQTRHTFVPKVHGKLFWRVNGSVLTRTDQGVFQAHSDSLNFQLQKSSKLLAPELQAPQNRSLLALDNEPAKIPFRWNSVVDAAEYLIEVSEKPDFSVIQHKLLTTETSIQWKTPKPGRFFWRVAALDKDKNRSEAGEVREIMLSSLPMLKLTEPKNQMAIQNDLENSELTLVWEKDGNASAYEVEMASDVFFSKEKIAFKSNQNRLQLKKIPFAVNFWRVHAINTASVPYKSSLPFMFKLSTRLISEAPNLQFPAGEQKELTLEPENNKLKFKWEKVPNAAEYELVITPAAQPGSASQILTFKSKDNQIEVGQLGFNSYQWGVRAIDTQGHYGKLSKQRTLTIQKAPPPPPPDVFTPVINHK